MVLLLKVWGLKRKHRFACKCNPHPPVNPEITPRPAVKCIDSLRFGMLQTMKTKVYIKHQVLATANKRHGWQTLNKSKMI